MGFTIKDVIILFSGDYLSSMTEHVVGQISATLISGAEDVCTVVEQIEILTFEEWPGTAIYPEIIASFVTPIHPAIQSIFKRASEILQRHNIIAMTTKQLRLTRGLWTMAICIAAIAIYTTIIRALPGYFDNYNGLRVTAKIIRFFCIMLLFGEVGTLIFKDYDIDDEEEMRYGPVYMLVLFEAISFIRYLRVRILGFHHFYAFGDNLGILVIIQAVLVIALLCLIHSVKYRRLLFENHSWRKTDDEDIVRMFTVAGIVFSVVVIIVIGTIETLNWYMYKPSREVDGSGYVELGLKSGTKWADRNLFSPECSSAGLKSLMEGISIDGDIVQEFMGDEWSVPTRTQWNELIEGCRSIPSYYRGVYGITFIGRNKYKRIFIPAPDSDLYDGTTYWSSSVVEAGEFDDYVITSKHATIQFSTLEYLPWRLIQEGETPRYKKCYIRPVVRQ